MADRKGSTAAGGAPAAGQHVGVRNVVLVGHSGAGKTTLVEALLVATGTIQRAGRVEDGTTVSDFDEVEIRQQRSVNLTLAPLIHAGVKVNLLDTPGYADFTGDLRAGLRAADAALFAVPATDGVDGLARMLWEECAAVGMPRAVVITKIDHQRADFDQALSACQEAFGDAVAPLYLPVSDAKGEVSGLIGLLSGRLFDYSSGTRTEGDPDAADADRVAELRGSLIEGIIQESEDESLMEAYLAEEDIDVKGLIEDLEKAVARGSFYPVLASSSPHGIGMAELLEVMTQAFPAPGERPLPAVTTLDGKAVTGIGSDPDGPLLAEVVKTTADPYVGRVSLVRVFSGTLRPDVVIHVSGHGLADRGHADHDADERVGALTSPLGKQQRPVPACPAGDICAVAKLTSAETGDTLSSKENPLLMEPWTMPEPLLPVAITAKSKADEDKLSQALARLVAEDPTLRMEMNPETRQLVLWCMGEAHADLLLDRLSSRYGVAVEKTGLRVALRETVAAKAQGLGPCRPAAASSSLTRSSVAWCHGSSSPRWKRACAPSWSRESRRVTRWWTSGSPCTTARRTRSTPPTWPSRRRAGPRSRTPRTRPGCCCWSRWTSCPCSSTTTTWARSCPTCRRGGGGCSAPSPCPAGGPWSRPRCPSLRSPGTRSTCGPCHMERARSPGPTCVTSRCPPTRPRRS
jgi:elongation factor G